MHEKLTKNKAYHRRLVKRRFSTVEPVLGTLINHHNMKRLNSRGMAQANKHVLMAALCYNLKKYLKFIPEKVLVIAQAVLKGGGALKLLVNGILTAKIKPYKGCRF